MRGQGPLALCLGLSAGRWQSADFTEGGSDGKESACIVGDLGSIPGLGRSPGEENGDPLQYSCLENSMDREAWQATVHGVSKSQSHRTTVPFPEIQSPSALLVCPRPETRQKGSPGVIIFVFPYVCSWGKKKKKTTVTFIKSKGDIKMPSIFLRYAFNPSSCIIKMTGNLVIQWMETSPWELWSREKPNPSCCHRDDRYYIPGARAITRLPHRVIIIVSVGVILSSNYH